MQKLKRQKSNTHKIWHISLTIFLIATICALGYYVLVWTGIWNKINSTQKIKKLILSMGFWGRFTFVAIQFLQVTILPIPSTISTLAGLMIYGPLQTSLLSLSGILFGSIFAFWLGRTFGRKLIIFMVGKETCQKWQKFLNEAKFSFVIMMLLPIFPDDILCLVAGITDMSWSFFTITNLISRPIGIFLTCYLGSGKIIPFDGLWLIFWFIFAVFVALALYISYKYQKQIEGFLKKTFKKQK